MHRLRTLFPAVMEDIIKRTLETGSDSKRHPLPHQSWFPVMEKSALIVLIGNVSRSHLSELLVRCCALRGRWMKHQEGNRCRFSPHGSLPAPLFPCSCQSKSLAWRPSRDGRILHLSPQGHRCCLRLDFGPFKSAAPGLCIHQQLLPNWGKLATSP